MILGKLDISRVNSDNLHDLKDHPYEPSTSLCYVSLFSGCWNIAYGGDPLYGGGQIVSAIAEADFDIPLPFFLQNVFFIYNT